MACVLLYVTAGDADEAARIGRALVAALVAASMTSSAVFWAVLGVAVSNFLGRFSGPPAD